MKVWKIIHKEKDHSKRWREVNSIVPAESREEAIKKLDRHPDLIKSVKSLGIQPKDTYTEYWDVWNEKIKSSQDKTKKILYDLSWSKKTNINKDQDENDSVNEKNTQ